MGIIIFFLICIWQTLRNTHCTKHLKHILLKVGGKLLSLINFLYIICTFHAGGYADKEKQMSEKRKCFKVLFFPIIRNNNNNQKHIVILVNYGVTACWLFKLDVPHSVWNISASEKGAETHGLRKDSWDFVCEAQSPQKKDIWNIQVCKNSSPSCRPLAARCIWMSDAE